MSDLVAEPSQSGQASRGECGVHTRVDEITERVYRLSTFVPSAGGPAGLTFNQLRRAVAR